MPNTNGHGPKTAVLYARVSTEEQAKKYSLPDQIDRLRSHATSEGFEVIAEIEDEGYSGAYLERPDLDQVRDLVNSGGVSVVLTTDRDRFSREPAYRFLLEREFSERGTEIRSLNDRGDDSPEGQLSNAILDQLAKFERAKTAERTRRGKMRKAREGKVIGSHRSRYGFTINDTRDGYVVDEKKMQLIRRVFRMVAEGHTLRSIARTLEREGIPTPKGAKFWDRSFFRTCVLDGVYKPHTYEEVAEAVSPDVAARLDPAKRYGLWWFNRKEMKSMQVSEVSENGRRYAKKYRTRTKPKEEWVAVPVPDSGIPREVVEAAREQIKENRAPSSAGNRCWVLSGGIGRCAVCGRVLRSRKRTKKSGERRYLYYYYRCSGFDAHGHKGCSNSRFASATKLERQVWNVVRDILLDPEQLRSDLDRAIELERQGARGNPEAQAKHWLDKLSEADEERRGFLRLSAKGRITDAELDEELAALDETRGIAEEELEALRGHQERVERLERDRDEVLEYYAAMAPEKLDALTSEERRQLYQILKLKVMVSKSGDLEMELAAVPVDSSGDGGESSTMGVRSRSVLTDGP